MAYIPGWRLPRPSVEHATGICIALTLNSGAVEVPLYAALGIPPVLGAPLMALAGMLGAIAFARLCPRFAVTKAALAPLGFWFILVLWAALSLAWSSAVDLAGAKLAQILGISTLFLMLGICAGFAADAFEALLGALFVIGLATAAAIFVFTNNGAIPAGAHAADALKTFADAYQATTQCVSLAAIVAFIQTIRRETGRFARWGWAAAWLILTLATLAGGGRGAAIAGAAAQCATLAFALFYYHGRPHAARLLYGLLALPLLAAGVLAIGSLAELRGIERLSSLANSLVDKTGRHALWSAALAMADRYPLAGAGLASFQASANNIESLGRYPHNVFLEVLAEYGLAGFVPFTGALVSSIVAVLRRARALPFAQEAAWLGLFVYILCEINVSGSVTDRIVAFIIGLSVGLAARSATAPDEGPSATQPASPPAQKSARTSPA